MKGCPRTIDNPAYDGPKQKEWGLSFGRKTGKKVKQELSTEVEVLREQKEEYESMIRFLKDELESLQTQKKDFDKLKEELARVKLEKKKLEDEITENRQRLAEIKKYKDSNLEEKNKSLGEQNSILSTEYDKLAAQFSSMKEDVSAIMIEKATLDSELEQLKSQKMMLIDKLAKLEEERDDILEETEAYKKEYKDLENMVRLNPNVEEYLKPHPVEKDKIYTLESAYALTNEKVLEGIKLYIQAITPSIFDISYNYPNKYQFMSLGYTNSGLVFREYRKTSFHDTITINLVHEHADIPFIFCLTYDEGTIDVVNKTISMYYLVGQVIANIEAMISGVKITTKQWSNGKRIDYYIEYDS